MKEAVQTLRTPGFAAERRNQSTESPTAAATIVENVEGERSVSVSRAESGSVWKYHRPARKVPATPIKPTAESTRAMCDFSAGSWIFAATMPPTTPVIVSMKAMRSATWAKVLGPKKAVRTPPVWCQSGEPGISMKLRIPVMTRSVATDANAKIIESRVCVFASTRPAR